jgi:hypothetical protein
MTINQFVDELNTKFGTLNNPSPISLDKPGARYTRVVVNPYGSRSVYCFIDAEGNIYKSASWKAPAKGIRSTLDTVDISKVDIYCSWLYR